MDQASSPVQSRERAVSSEPCSTRPNPFDDSEISSRKRRRTSLSGASRSRSVDSVTSSRDEDMQTRPDSEAEDGSSAEMKLDAADHAPGPAAAPQTPDRKPADSQPPSEARKVTINVRTPSRPLETIPSSPPSAPSAPSANGHALPTPVPISLDDEVKISVEETEVEMAPVDLAADTPASFDSAASSPPVELVELDQDDDIELDSAQSPVILLQDTPVDIPSDPTCELPFHDVNESYAETVTRLAQYMPTHESVSKHLSEWIESYLLYTKAAGHYAALESYIINRNLWQTIPDLVIYMANRRNEFPRNRGLRADIFTFYRWFAKLTAYFIEFDLKTLRHSSAEQPRMPELASTNYIHALAMVTWKEDFGTPANNPHNGDAAWNYVEEVPLILGAFQAYHPNLGASLAYLAKLAQIETELIPRFPKITENLGPICCLACALMRENFRKSNATATFSSQEVEQALSDIARGYDFFKLMSSTLSHVVENHVNHLSHDSASNQLTALAEIYQICLSTEQVVPTDVISEHRRNHPQLADDIVPEAMAYHWRFTLYRKLIMSSQMQLRVMAASSMSGELVAFWRRFGEPSDEPRPHFLVYVVDFLIGTGLVAYILGPTCHPEITVDSSNIIGFLLVSNTYTRAHTDLMWQTVTSSQDPRVSDALIRMATRITNLYPYDHLVYLCEKLNTVAPEAFGPTVREFFDQVLRFLVAKMPTILAISPYLVCVRLIKQSSVFGRQSPVAHPDLLSFSSQKLNDILLNGPDAEGRRQMYLGCLQDIAERSPTALGSLCVIHKMLRPLTSRELQLLTDEHDFARLLVDELEAAIPAARAAGFPAVIHGAHNLPRRELITSLLLHHPAAITNDLGPRLWNLLVGSGAACREDRDASWHILNQSPTWSHAENPFISKCFSEYLPTLPPECFCHGTLEFVRKCLLPLVNDSGSILLDDDDDVSGRGGLEQLWRMILTAPPQTIELQAIHTLVNDVYMESRSIVSFPHHRARKVHLAMVDRCLRQLSSAAASLKASGGSAANGDAESMVLVASDKQVQDQGLLFVRSLAVLREFHRLHQAKAQFSAPDLRSLILDSPSKGVQGDSAELKYQSFDGNTQTEVMPLNIGKRNTAASLLASLQEATGFNNYRIYYRGRPFLPQESEICKSLEDLRIHNGIILVKRESDVASTPTRVRPGASAVEIKILGHFDELWDYLSMEQRLAQEIYSFLIKLPADDNILGAIKSLDTPHTEVFPPGQPLKSLYAVHVLGDHLASQHKALVAQLGTDVAEAEELTTQYSNFLTRAISLVVAAISDQEAVEQCPNPELQIDLSSALVDSFVRILQEPLLPAAVSKFLDASFLRRLIQILSSTMSGDASEIATKHICLCLLALFECCSRSSDAWDEFCTHDQVPGLVADLLLNDARPEVRRHMADMIASKVVSPPSPDAAVESFCAFFWPLVSGLVGPAMSQPRQSEEIFGLALSMLNLLRDSKSPILDVHQLLADWGDLLLAYTTFEDATQPDILDPVAVGLLRLMHSLVCWEGLQRDRHLPPIGFARKVFWKHLFPPFESDGRVPLDAAKPILFLQSRRLMMDIILVLIKNDPVQIRWLVEDLDELVPVYNDDSGEPYAYELAQQFERSKAIRAACGYVGLKNLSNTCYLNSLFTQLFMNTDFRRFILGTVIQDRQFSQNLLFQTQKLFAFMQESNRRFMNPEECIATIKTFDDNQIDIHNQMDVDEFYNLLFDRWEGQLLTPQAKRQLRSFYGGHLVQQVASKECDHISERLEPFSAIQCDIKGKSSLQESLQAYVDGEIMEGDNKYKCSTCDRHVDAVKRACLKDIPDNLIFHLKRFDFNVRTLQRSKINDFFTFPSEVDMRPYTVEHLNNSSEERPPDIFELVGVLVHAGTAESGHYYSYIRERPTTSDSEVWVEFNDETVSPWDQGQMETACFGGPDYRTPYDNSGVVYDKTYSAYMLFYQRSSTVKKEQALLRQSGVLSPLHVPLSQDIGQYIQRENLSLLRRHCIYDPTHIHFVHMTLYQLKAMNNDGCTELHELEDKAIRMALSHLDQVASRAKDAPDFDQLLKRLAIHSQSCPRCSLAIYNYFNQNSEAMRMLVQRNAEQAVRKGTSDLLIQALHVIKLHLPQTYGIPLDDSDELTSDSLVIHGVIRMFNVLFDFFHLSIRSWHEVFGLMLSFVQMGPHEKAAFLEHPFLRFLILLISADLNMEMPQQFARMIATVSRRLPNRPPSYDNIIGLLNELLSSMHIPFDENGDAFVVDHLYQRLRVSDGVEGPYVFTRVESRLLHQDWSRGQANIFVDKLIGIHQNHPATYSILANLIRCSRLMEDKIFRTLRLAIGGHVTAHLNSPYLQVASQVYCRFGTQPVAIDKLVAHINQQCMCLQNTEGRAFLEFQRDVFDTPREKSGESREEVLLMGLENLADWVPGLLGYFDSVVTGEVELFLHEKLFRFGSSPDFGDTIDGMKRAEVMVNSARSLGTQCLVFLRDTYVNQRMSVSTQLVVTFERVIKECRNYFDLNEPIEDSMTADFVKLAQSVFEPLRKLAVEDPEEDGSDWEEESQFSEQADGLGEIILPGVGVLNDPDC